MSSYRLYTLFFIGKSTAWVVPIFSIFLVNEKGVSVSEIVYIAGIFGILPFIFEVPFGMLSDKWSNMKVLKLGLVSFILAFLSILILDGIQSYFFYMLCITLSSSFFSGAEDKLLSSIVNYDDIEQYKFKLNSLFYKATIPMILIGGVLYNIKADLPFYFQLASFFISFIALYRIPEIQQNKSKKKESTLDLIKKSTTDVYNVYFLSIAFVGAVCTFLVSINTRTVQIHFEQLLELNPTVVIGLFFVIGNVVSAYTSDVYKNYLMNRWRLDTNIIMLGSVAFLAFLFMSIENVAAVFVGYMIICAFKSVYRPIVSANLMTALKKKQSLSTAMSIAAMLSATMGLLFSALYSWFFTSFESVNLVLSFLVVVVFPVCALIIRQYNEDITEQLDTRSMSQKKHFVKRSYSQWSYIQEYPREENINELFLRDENRHYPSPKLLSKSENQVEWEYVSGDLLSDLCREQQLSVIAEFSAIYTTLNTESSGEIVIHGDLHPDNIIVNEGRIYVIDWDLATIGDPMFDALTLITSPRLDITNQERITFIVNAFNASKKEVHHRMVDFLREKSDHLNVFLEEQEVDGYFFDLVSAYRELTVSFSMSESYES